MPSYMLVQILSSDPDGGHLTFTLNITVPTDLGYVEIPFGEPWVFEYLEIGIELRSARTPTDRNYRSYSDWVDISNLIPEAPPAGPPETMPEPSTLLLLGTGLI